MQQKSQTTHSICKLEIPHPNPIKNKLQQQNKFARKLKRNSSYLWPFTNALWSWYGALILYDFTITTQITIKYCHGHVEIHKSTIDGMQKYPMDSLKREIFFTFPPSIFIFWGFLTWANPCCKHFIYQNM